MLVGGPDGLTEMSVVGSLWFRHSPTLSWGTAQFSGHVKAADT